VGLIQPSSNNIETPKHTAMKTHPQSPRMKNIDTKAHRRYYTYNERYTNFQEGTMTEMTPKERILENAVSMFSKKGYHGTSMRELAAASGCSLPTMYYHYKSKNDLFEEIVINQFLLINEKMNSSLHTGMNPEDIYFQVIKSKMELEGFDREVYKLALKVWLGFEGEGTARDKIREWEQKRAEANRSIIGKAVADDDLRDDVTEILINYTENIIKKIILMDEKFDDDRLKRQLDLLFHIGK
jgi:AcrR family transcriptional regulator